MPRTVCLYGMHVTDFPHVRQLFTDAYLLGSWQ